MQSSNLETSIPTRKTGSAPDTAPLVAQFVRILSELCDVYRQMAPLGEARRSAVRTADAPALRETIEKEATLVARLRDLNRQRVACVTALTRIVGRPERAEATATWLSEQLPPEQGEEVRELAVALREAIERVQKRVATDRLATETIAAHLQGLVRTAGDAMSHAQTYGRSGQVERGRHQVVSLMDVTS